MFGIWGGFCCSISSGLLTAVLVNHWLDDSAAGDGPARLLSLLGGHFNLVLQSCRSGHKVPEPAMFSSALQHLGVTSQQVDCIYICLSVTITVYPGRFQREYQCSMFSCPSDFRLCGWMQTRKVWRQQREQGWRPSWWKIWMTLWANWPTLLEFRCGPEQFDLVLLEEGKTLTGRWVPNKLLWQWTEEQDELLWLMNFTRFSFLTV